jgi:hypothetical protein
VRRTRINSVSVAHPVRPGVNDAAFSRSIASLGLAALVFLAPRIGRADDTSPTKASPSAPEATSATTERTEAPAAEATAANGVVLHVTSPETVSVENSDTGSVVCTSPCDKTVSSSARYRIGGGRPSPDFVLTSSNGRADVKVKPASPAKFWTGVGALALGGLLIAGGVGVLVYGVENRPAVAGGDGTETDNTFTDTMSVGTSLAILGTVSALLGGAIVLSNASTKVRGDLNTARLSPQVAPSARAASATAVVLPKITSAPLFTGTF